MPTDRLQAVPQRTELKKRDGSDGQNLRCLSIFIYLFIMIHHDLSICSAFLTVSHLEEVLTWLEKTGP